MSRSWLWRYPYRESNMIECSDCSYTPSGIVFVQCKACEQLEILGEIAGSLAECKNELRDISDFLEEITNRDQKFLKGLK